MEKEIGLGAIAYINLDTVVRGELFFKLKLRFDFNYCWKPKFLEQRMKLKVNFEKCFIERIKVFEIMK